MLFISIKLVHSRNEIFSDPVADVSDSCFITGDAIGGTSIDEGFAVSNRDCEGRVRDSHPTANGASFAKKTFFTQKLRKCYAQFEMTGVNPDESSFLTCHFDKDPITGNRFQ